MTKQEMRTEATKKAILQAAEQEFSEKGLYGCRVDEIARRAKVNKALLYRHFNSKEELYKEVLVRVYTRLGDLEEQVINLKTDYELKLRDLVQIYFQFLYDNPSFVRMVMWENLNGAKSFKERGVAETKNPILHELGRIIDEARLRSDVPETIDSDQLILTLIACSFNYFSNMNTLNIIVGKDLMLAENREKRIQATTEMLLAYLKEREQKQTHA
nr:TetR/AcrR family transcriptional regulator [uncultured Sphaerochaeta sp.]